MNKKAFTLIELMVVVMIISLLLIMVIPNINRAIIESKQTKAQVILKSISTELEIHYSINTEYPITSAELLRINYFENAYHGYKFEETLTSETYLIKAISLNEDWKNYSISTGGVLK